MKATPPSPPSTPCVQICVIDPGSGLCLGCGRTLSEIAGWGDLDEASRLAIMDGLEARLIAARSRKARGRPLRAREGS
jgi:hypothetical protein